MLCYFLLREHCTDAPTWWRSSFIFMVFCFPLNFDVMIPFYLKIEIFCQVTASNKHHYAANIFLRGCLHLPTRISNAHS